MLHRAYRVIVSMSGGVDSSVAALLLKRQGFEVHGVYMKNWDDIEEAGHCSGVSDAEDAEWVCKHLDIPFHTVNFVKEFWNNVFSELLSDYEFGWTPIPDILCNKYVKFNVFHRHARNFGASAIATGHYARSSYGTILQNADLKTGVRLLQAEDKIKDQTFFLSQISQEALQNTMFPLGDLWKHQVKSLAEQNGLKRIAKKKESTGICFIGRRNFQDFICQYLVPNSGNFIDIETGKVVGEHSGVHTCTIGQRCRIAGHDYRYYIVKKDRSTQQIFVAHGTDHPSLYADMLFTDVPHWIHPSTNKLLEGKVLKCMFRFQNTYKLMKCEVAKTTTGRLIVKLEWNLRAITPGQFAVFYDKEECLGSARILNVGPSLYELDDHRPLKVNDRMMKLVQPISV